MRLKNKIAIITGGASGIGKSAAILFAQHGAKIVVADIDEQGAKQTVADIQDIGNEAVYVQTDVTISANTERMVAEAVSRYGKLDILLSSAGIAMRLPVADLPEEDWHRCLDVNLTGVYLCAKAAIPAMKKNGGSIINLSSIYGLVGAEIRAAYAASKGGVTNLTRSMALDYAKEHIRVNCICPGFVETPLVAEVVKTPQEYRKLADRHPMRRLAQPEEIAYGALYLASDESAFVTGIALPIDGGYTAG